MTLVVAAKRALWALALAAGIGLGGAKAQEEPQATPVPTPFALGRYEVRIDPVAGSTGGQALTVRDGRVARLRIKDSLVTVAYRKVDAGSGPDVIVTSYSGGAHCCTTVHLVTFGKTVAVTQKIHIADSELLVEDAGDAQAPRLRFYDFAFAYWNASFADSPAPQVVLRFDPARRRYVADGAAMRKPLPPDDSLQALAASMRAPFARLPRGQYLPELWGEMLDLVYSGNMPAAMRMLDIAWPPERPGKEDFRASFLKQLRGGRLWREFSLGTVLGTQAR